MTPETPLSLQESRYSEMLVSINGLARQGFEDWFFCPGMLFNSTKKWWGDHGLRDFPHEGVDVCLYRDRSGLVQRLGENNRIPSIADGTVKAIFIDYLGQALIVEHEEPGSGDRRFLSIYAHTRPRAGIQVGTIVKRGEIIANLAGTRRAKTAILPHLHFSLALPSPSLTYDAFHWNVMRNPEMVRLLDPTKSIDFPHRVMATDDALCRDL